ncbi:hypothetical protein [Selenomonas sp. AB3002]|uniref:hypothetical protein n=1 Tax=Selenomonas sp. AB3002 TaxID=1392502 RepID=UPI000495067E
MGTEYKMLDFVNRNRVQLKEDLLRYFGDYEVEVYSRGNKGYEYLEADDFVLVIKNPYCNKTLDIELRGDFTVFFSDWHAHYFAFDNDYEEMKKDILGLLRGKIGVMLAVDSLNKPLSSHLCSARLTGLTDKFHLLNRYVHSEDVARKIIKMGGSIHIVCWNPADSSTFDIPAEC